MSDMDINDAEREAREQQARASRLKLEIEQHTDRVRKLEQLKIQIDVTQRQLRSEGALHAGDDILRARQATEQHLIAMKKERGTLLRENQALIERVRQARQAREDLFQRSWVIASMTAADDARERAFGESAASALRRDTEHFTAVEAELEAARRKLEALAVEGG
jgi:beta-glucosidase-like glycosyl hydrolase